MNRRLLLTLASVALPLARIILARSKASSDLRQKTVLITGGSRGLGLLLAREFGLEGCRVAICARDEKELDRAKMQLSEWGVAEVLSVRCDVTDPAEVTQLMSTVREYFGAVDILVNNAGVIQTGPLASQTLADFKDAMDIIFWGSLYPIMEILPQMQRRNSGHIVNITSIGGKVAVPHLLPYASAKFATTAFSEGLTAELAGTNIRVTTVIPGLMRTGSYLNAYFKGQHKAEFQLFSLFSTLPLSSIDAESAAKQIVGAVKRGDTEIILSIPAQLLARFYGMFPATSIQLMGWVNRLALPAGSNPAKMRGMLIQEQVVSPVFNFLTTWGRSAARRFNQYRETDRIFDDEKKPIRVNGFDISEKV